MTPLSWRPAGKDNGQSNDDEKTWPLNFLIIIIMIIIITITNCRCWQWSILLYFPCLGSSSSCQAVSQVPPNTKQGTTNQTKSSKQEKNATEQGTTTQNIFPGQTARPIQSLADKIFVNDKKGGLALMFKNHLQFTVQENCLLQKILESWSILTPWESQLGRQWRRSRRRGGWRGRGTLTLFRRRCCWRRR